MQAQSTLALSQVEFAPSPEATFSPIPQAGVEQIVRIRMSGHPSDLRAFLVNGAFERLADVALTVGDEPGTFVGRVK